MFLRKYAIKMKLDVIDCRLLWEAILEKEELENYRKVEYGMHSGATQTRKEKHEAQIRKIRCLAELKENLRKALSAKGMATPEHPLDEDIALHY